MTHMMTKAGQVAGIGFENGSGEVAIPDTPELEPIPGESLDAWRQRVALEAAYKLAGYGFACFPCVDERVPACPGGLEQATTDPGTLAALWKNHPGGAVGVATGAASGIDILRIDAKHGIWWWCTHRYEVPRTHLHWNSLGGFNFAFQHQPEVPSLDCCPVPGCDILADGDYIIWWPAEGLPCVHAAPAQWPAWLLDLVTEARRFVGLKQDEAMQALRQQALAALDYAMEEIGTAPAPENRNLLLTHSRTLRRVVPLALTAGEINEAMMAAAYGARMDYDEVAAILT